MNNIDVNVNMRPEAAYGNVKMRASWLAIAVALCAGVGMGTVQAANTDSPRARDLGVPFHGSPGPLNAITDVAGVAVGQITLSDEARGGPARTGVTAILPLGSQTTDGVLAGQFDFNGTGEMTGTHVVHEFGAFFGPVLLTGTTSVGTVSEGVLRWSRAHVADPVQRFSRLLPIVAETYDGELNDAWGLLVRAEDAIAALESARGGPVAEGNVGGGTGMVAHDFKAGIGTASRIVTVGGQTLTVGVLVQANYGNRELLTIAGVPVGREIPDLLPTSPTAERKEGSIIIIIATDAPLSSTQLERMAKRATIGLARVGGLGGATSGDLFLAFSTANRVALFGDAIRTYRSVAPEYMTLLFQGVADATEESIVNALVAARTMTGYDGRTVYALPHDRLVSALTKYGRLKH
jgi:D-aminopeptidase